MKISTKGRYGTRFMVHLALHAGKAPIPLREVAKAQDISDKYLEQIVPQLGRANLIRSVRGPQGGYVLARDPSAITVGEILRVLEGPLTPVDCVECLEAPCARESICAVRAVWSEIYDAINAVVDHITLEDIVKRSRKIGDSFNYNI